MTMVGIIGVIGIVSTLRRRYNNGEINISVSTAILKVKSGNAWQVWQVSRGVHWLLHSDRETRAEMQRGRPTHKQTFVSAAVHVLASSLYSQVIPLDIKFSSVWVEHFCQTVSDRAIEPDKIASIHTTGLVRPTFFIYLLLRKCLHLCRNLSLT